MLWNTNNMLTPRERYRADLKQEVAELIGEYGQESTARLLNVHPTTVKRWLDGSSDPPEAVRISLRAAVYNQVPGMEGKYWQGWRMLKDGTLRPPGDKPRTVGDIMSQTYERQLIKVLQRKVAELEEQLAKERGLTHFAANDPVSRHG